MVNRIIGGVKRLIESRAGNSRKRTRSSILHSPQQYPRCNVVPGMCCAPSCPDFVRNLKCCGRPLDRMKRILRIEAGRSFSNVVIREQSQ